MLVNQMTNVNLEALLMYDRDLFVNMKVPQGMEKTMVVQAIRRKHGLAPLYHPDPVWMKTELYFWSTENLPIWEKLLATTQYDYNPIWNTDAHIITKDTTVRDKDTSAQSVQKNKGDVSEKSQHAGSKDGWSTDGTLYHEDTTGDGWNTGTDARHGDTSGTSESQTHGTLHEQTTGTSHTDTDGTSLMQKDGTSKSDTIGNRTASHIESQTDDLTTTKTSTTDIEGKISSENEASYQPYDTQHTDYDEKGTAVDRKSIDWTENETTGSNTTGETHETDDGKTHETSDTKTTGTRDQETTGQETGLTTGHSDEIGRQSGEYGDKGSTAARGHTEGKNGERDTAHDARAGSHSDTTHGMETGKEKETVTFIHEESRGGNIGVTTTQAMIAEERQSVLFNVYDIIADSFHRTFCLDIY